MPCVPSVTNSSMIVVTMYAAQATTVSTIARRARAMVRSVIRGGIAGSGFVRRSAPHCRRGRGAVESGRAFINISNSIGPDRSDMSKESV